MKLKVNFVTKLSKGKTETALIDLTGNVTRKNNLKFDKEKFSSKESMDIKEFWNDLI